MKTILTARRFLALGIAIFATSLSAQVMISPVAVTESGLGTFDSTTIALTNMINHSGIQTPFTNGVTVFDTYFTPNDKFSKNADGTKWQSLVSFNLPLVGNLDFDLGASYLISRIAIWNVSVKEVSVSIAEDQAGLDTAIPVGTFTLTQGLFSLSLRADLLTLASPTQGRFLRFRVLSEYKFSAGDTFAYATVGEVAVAGTSGVTIPPSLSIRLGSNGDATMTFSGTLQSSPNAESGYQDVPGNPQGSHTVPQSSLVTQQFFRAVGN